MLGLIDDNKTNSVSAELISNQTLTELGKYKLFLIQFQLFSYHNFNCTMMLLLWALTFLIAFGSGEKNQGEGKNKIFAF